MKRILLSVYVALEMNTVAMAAGARVTSPNGDHVPERAAQHGSEVGLLGCYGESDVFGAGLGGRVGLSLNAPARPYFGTVYVHHFGNKTESGDGRISNHAFSDRFGLELGPTFYLGPILLRPLIGVGAIAPQVRYCDLDVCFTESASPHWTVSPYLAGGTLAAWRFGDAFLGLEALLVFVTRVPVNGDVAEDLSSLVTGVVFGFQL